MVAAAAAAVVDVVVVVIVLGDNPLAEGVPLVSALISTGPTAESLSAARAGQEDGFGLGFGLGFEFFDSELSLLD